MKTDLLEMSTREIILEAVYQRIPFETFMRIHELYDLESIDDLHFVLYDDEYDTVLTCVKSYFSRKAVALYLKYVQTRGFDIMDKENLL